MPGEPEVVVLVLPKDKYAVVIYDARSERLLAITTTTSKRVKEGVYKKPSEVVWLLRLLATRGASAHERYSDEAAERIYRVLCQILSTPGLTMEERLREAFRYLRSLRGAGVVTSDSG